MEVSTDIKDSNENKEIKESNEIEDIKTYEVSNIRIAIVGNVDCGKSILVGVLTGGTLDDGRESARSRVFVHIHEASNGRTSCISQHIAGFDNENNPVYNEATASSGCQAVIHCGAVRQSALIKYIDKEYLRSGDEAIVVFEFIDKCAYLNTGDIFVFREGNTKGLGKVKKMNLTEEDKKKYKEFNNDQKNICKKILKKKRKKQ
jgi:GTPase